MTRFLGLFLGMALLAGCDPTETCYTYTAAGSCPSGGTLQYCVSLGSGWRYRTSDGTEFPCSSASDQSCATKAAAWCQTH